MDKMDIVDEALEIPRKFNTIGTISMADLVKNCGYCQLHKKIRPQDFRSRLEQKPEYIEDWLQYSEDKRSSNGWYIHRAKASQGAIVGSLYDGIRIQSEYDSEIDACSAFIKSELEAIRTY